MEIKTHLASESLSPEDMMVSLEPMTYEPPAIIPVQKTTELNCYQRRARLKVRSTPVQPAPEVQPNIQIHSVMQPVSQPQVQPDQDPIVPNLGPSAFRRSPKRMTLSSNRNTSNVPESGISAESLKEARLRHIRADSIWWGVLMTYYSNQNVRFKLSSLQLQELEKLDTEILDTRDRTERYDCTLLMKKFLLLESYNIPDIGGVYDDETISKNFPMDLLKMILIKKGHNTDNLSKTQIINELNSYDRTVLAFTMVSSKIWGPRI